MARATLGLDLDLAFSTIEAALKTRPPEVVQDICAQLSKTNALAARRAKQWPWRTDGEWKQPVAKAKRK